MAFRRISWIALAFFLVIQLIPSARTNPPVQMDLPAPPEIRSLLHRACYDCHSNETQWPWYSAIAPVSWLVIHDVDEAREHMNFSTWNTYDEDEQRDHLEECWEEIEDGEMPLWYYLPLHPSAQLTDTEKEKIRDWVAAQSGD